MAQTGSALQRLFPLLLLLILREAVALTCDDCVTNIKANEVCTTTCQGEHCFHDLTRSNDGRENYLKKSCVNTPNIKFDDGTLLNVVNQCVFKQTLDYSYVMKVCNDYDICNRDCQNPQPMPVTCYDCVTTDGSDCMVGSCQGYYCTYRREPWGDTSRLIKTCSDKPEITFDDGHVLTHVGTCQTRATVNGKYLGEICSYDNCNDACNSPIGPLPRPVYKAYCYKCTSNDGSDCMTGSCTASYCIIQLEKHGDITSVRKGCSDKPQLVFDDGYVQTDMDICKLRKTVDADYLGKICTTDLCNSACYPIPPTPIRTISCTSCEADNAVDCTGETCHGHYCIYDRNTSSAGISHVKRSCSPLGFVRYPDGSQSTTLNGCEYRKIGDNNYAANVCNSGDFCNLDTCNGNNGDSLISCKACAADNAADCTGQTCQGQYCIYERQTPSSGTPSVKRFCSPFAYDSYPDKSRTSTLNVCEYKKVDGVNFATIVCNSDSCYTEICSGGSTHLHSFLLLFIFSLLVALNMLNI